jgi:hypothetical protein
MQQYIPLSITTDDTTTPTAQTPTTPNTQEADYIHNFSDIEWNSEEEPPLPIHSKHPQQYHLLTITGLLLIAYYPHDTHTLGEHYLAWAPLTSEAKLAIH